MLDKHYINMLVHYIAVLIEKEEVEINLEELHKIDSSKFDNYLYHTELILILDECMKRSIRYETIEIYKHILKGLTIELNIGITLN